MKYNEFMGKDRYAKCISINKVFNYVEMLNRVYLMNNFKLRRASLIFKILYKLEFSIIGNSILIRIVYIKNYC